MFKKLIQWFVFTQIQDKYLLSYFHGCMIERYGQKIASNEVEVDTVNHLLKKGLIKRSDVFFKGDDIEKSMNDYLKIPATSYEDYNKRQRFKASRQRYVNMVNKKLLNAPYDYVCWKGSIDSLKKYHRLKDALCLK